MHGSTTADGKTDRDPLATLAAFASGLRRDDLPDPVVAHAKLMMLDLLGVMISGAGEDRVRRMTAALRRRGSIGRSFVIGDGGTCDAADAALVNGTAGCVHVLEDGHKYARGHFSNNVIPAILAVAEEQAVSGAEFLTAFIAAYEVAVRVTMSCRIRPEMHSSGTCHTIGTTAGVARMMGLSVPQIRETMNLAAPLTLATSWNAAEDGATVRDLYAGYGGSNAVWAPRWVQSGFTGAEDDISHVFGIVSSEIFVPERLTDGLGTRWEVLRNYFKIHACCRSFQSAIDAALDIMAKHPIRPDDIADVEVVTFGIPVRRNARAEARNAIAAKESLPITLALTLIHGHCHETLFSHENVFAAETGHLVSRIRISGDPALDALFPEQQPSTVTITLRDGRRLQSHFPVPVGDPRCPMGPAELDEKFMRLTGNVLGDGATTLRAAILNIDRLSSVADLTKHLRPLPPSSRGPDNDQAEEES